MDSLADWEQQNTVSIDVPVEWLDMLRDTIRDRDTTHNPKMSMVHDRTISILENIITTYCFREYVRTKNEKTRQQEQDK